MKQSELQRDIYEGHLSGIFMHRIGTFDPNSMTENKRE